MAQLIDLRKVELADDAVPVADQVAAGDFSMSGTGMFIYRTGAAARLGQLTLFDRQGTIIGTIGEPGS